MESAENIKSLNSWEEFNTTVKAFQDMCIQRNESNNNYKPHTYLYRGVPNSTWELETTLERFTNKKLNLSDYYSYAYSIKNKVETFTEKTWELLKPSDYDNWLKTESYITILNLKGYDYFAYLRHHGFPSPLLDWSASPYIALFFAFRNYIPNVKYVSVYTYVQNIGMGWCSNTSDPAIEHYGPYVTVHPRHLLQQSQYTMCTKKNESNFEFASHSDVVNPESGTDVLPTQNLSWKINIPAKDRRAVLEYLETVNINAYSLFGTLDGLMEASANTGIIP